MDRPNPQDYVNPRVLPRETLNKVFVIIKIHDKEYEEKPNLLLEILIENAEEITDMYISNTTIMNFLNDIRGTEYLSDPLELFKSSPKQPYLEIRWVDRKEKPTDDIPF